MTPPPASARRPGMSAMLTGPGSPVLGDAFDVVGKVDVLGVVDVDDALGRLLPHALEVLPRVDVAYGLVGVRCGIVQNRVAVLGEAAYDHQVAVGAVPGLGHLLVG